MSEPLANPSDAPTIPGRDVAAAEKPDPGKPSGAYQTAATGLVVPLRWGSVQHEAEVWIDVLQARIIAEVEARMDIGALAATRRQEEAERRLLINAAFGNATAITIPSLAAYPLPTRMSPVARFLDEVSLYTIKALVGFGHSARINGMTSPRSRLRCGSSAQRRRGSRAWSPPRQAEGEADAQRCHDAVIAQTRNMGQEHMRIDRALSLRVVRRDV